MLFKERKLDFGTVLAGQWMQEEKLGPSSTSKDGGWGKEQLLLLPLLDFVHGKGEVIDHLTRV